MGNKLSFGGSKKDTSNLESGGERDTIQERTQLDLEEISEPYFPGARRSVTVLLAYKNEATYMIAGAGGRTISHFKIFKDSKEVHSDELPHQSSSISGLVYSDHLDCFLLLISDKIYQKGINSNPIQLFMDLSRFGKEFSSLVYSPIHRKLITPNPLLVIDMGAKRVDLNLGEPPDAFKLMDWKLFGKQQKQAVSLFMGGYLGLSTFNFEMRRQVAYYELQIEMIEEREEGVYSLAVGDDNSHVLVEILGHGRYSSRMMIFRVENCQIVKKAVFDSYAQDTIAKKIMSCCGCFGGHIMWIGFEFDSAAKGRALVYDYDSETGVLRELEGRRVDHDIPFLRSAQRVGESFFYASNEGKIWRLGITSEAIEK